MKLKPKKNRHIHGADVIFSNKDSNEDKSMTFGKTHISRTLREENVIYAAHQFISVETIIVDGEVVKWVKDSCPF